MEFLPEESVQLFDEQIQMHCKSSKHQLAYIDMKSKMDSTEVSDSSVHQAFLDKLVLTISTK
ncbi:Hypothetical protein FKW44_023283 [Caligus rogercresseyi]|uniref:Uncharacterized protein n=1 Tax=Caligus rogercresseyi TaxID=217165 RepID=A0A7T8JU52_CALRO|nr:Hypothetical protein FKW44_023283 [Caligus rogercresseyi]